MVLLAVLVLAVLTVPLAGGRLAALGDLQVRWGWAVVAAIGLQVLIISVFPDRFEALHEPLHLLSYGFAALFVYANIRLPGVLLIALGGLLNLIAIVANGGVMPASRAAQRSAGIVQSDDGFANSAALEDPELLFLGDVFAIPDSVPYLDNVFSIGDVLIAVGAFVLIHGVCGSRLIPRWAGGSRAASIESGA